MNKNLIIGLDCLLNRRLVGVQKLVRSGSIIPIEIGLVFEDEFYATFSCDAEGLSFVGDSISPLMMGDYGDYVVEEIVGDDVFASVANETLTAAFIIQSDVENSLVGVKFVFGKLGLNIVNSDAKLAAYSKIPQAVRIAGKYRLVPLR